MHFPLQDQKDPLWVYPNIDSEWIETIAKEFRVHPVVAQILTSRGYTSPEQVLQFLYAKLPDLLDPFLLAEMHQAVNRAVTALEKGENILIYGDNDVDGMTGTTLLTEFFQELGANVYYYVSHRGLPRDGLIVEALEYALAKNCKLLITVDCGITAAAEIAKVIEKGVDVIITDHHEPTDTIPHCVATLNPKLLNNTYPNRDLTGVGVAFKLAHAVILRLVSEKKIEPKAIDLKKFLDLVALGTISDMGPLVGENRIMVRYGIRQLRQGQRVGLAKLISIAEVDLDNLSTFMIASKIAPRLNSLGRIADPQKGVDVLLVKEIGEAERMARELDLNNTERQKIERVMSVDVEAEMAKHPEFINEKAIVMESGKWHPGVIAILSTRISKYYNRPTVMIAIEKGVGKGSLRSIHSFPLLDVLKQCSDLLLNFGGHDFAAGMTIPEENIPEFKQRFIAIANAKLDAVDVMNKLYLDAKVDFHDLTFDLMESLSLLEPYGNENPAPVLWCEAKQAWYPKVLGKNNLKLFLAQDDERVLEAIAFGRGVDARSVLRRKNLRLLIAFTPQVNKSSIQLFIKHYKILEPEEGDKKKSVKKSNTKRSSE